MQEFLIGANILLIVFQGLLSAYLAKKGTNLADKEDIGDITSIVKTIESKHALLLEETKRKNQYIFGIGATSHMANVVFDKHIEFCEAYMQEVGKTLKTLVVTGMQDGQYILEHANTLLHLRQKHAAWVTEDIEQNLVKFETALRDIHQKLTYAKNTFNQPHNEQQRMNAITGAYDIFNTILGINGKFDTTENKEQAAEEIKKKIRNYLGIEELTKLRIHLIKGAIKDSNLFLKTQENMPATDIP